MTEPMAIAQTQIDRCRAQGIDIVLHDGSLMTIGARPSAQRLRLLRNHEREIRRLLGDDGGAHLWAVRQVQGGALLYEHPRFSHRATGEDEMSSMSMPFGRYRGMPLNRVATDTGYVGWLLAQPWFNARFPKHHRLLKAVLARNGIEGPSAA